LEVLLALALFVVAAAVVTTALSAALDSVERQKLNTQGLNLAASVLAEVQLGIRSAGGEGAKPFETPFQDWTWEAASSPVESGSELASGLSRVEVIVRHTKSAKVQRLAQIVRLSGAVGTSTKSAQATSL
jgi:type II secretory pathway pseudopilin PulG